MRFFYGIFLCLFVVIGSFYLCFKPNPYELKGVSENNSTICLKNFNKDYKIVYFGYLYCPDVCPSALSTISKVLDEIARDDIKLILVTLDPERDTAKMLNDYVKNFSQNSIGMVLNDLETTAKNYGVKYKKIMMPDSAMIYSIAHSSSFYLLDKKGKFHSEISNLTEEDIKEAILQMINK
ncbi:hypothetical protein LMG7974_00223 [Campylobacter majalis]|uniref:SCO family protein n=1 Tax=Campylobacter majalis TaxID=2790656 RepID=A0ABM8Q316_9BACT|nr:SCO family protein [Campylobacter majalis]CAD7287293.1 hypothetical protein LMG7974_00223 [Campylobacter majalis]